MILAEIRCEQIYALETIGSGTRVEGVAVEGRRRCLEQSIQLRTGRRHACTTVRVRTSVLVSVTAIVCRSVHTYCASMQVFKFACMSANVRMSIYVCLCAFMYVLHICVCAYIIHVCTSHLCMCIHHTCASVVCILIVHLASAFA